MAHIHMVSRQTAAAGVRRTRVLTNINHLVCMYRILHGLVPSQSVWKDVSLLWTPAAPVNHCLASQLLLTVRNPITSNDWFQGNFLIIGTEFHMTLCTSTTWNSLIHWFVKSSTSFVPKVQIEVITHKTYLSSLSFLTDPLLFLFVCFVLYFCTRNSTRDFMPSKYTTIEVHLLLFWWLLLIWVRISLFCQCSTWTHYVAGQVLALQHSWLSGVPPCEGYYSFP